MFFYDVISSYSGILDSCFFPSFHGYKLRTVYTFLSGLEQFMTRASVQSTIRRRVQLVYLSARNKVRHGCIKTVEIIGWK